MPIYRQVLSRPQRREQPRNLTSEALVEANQYCSGQGNAMVVTNT
jgi:hypothetical protein